MKARYGEAKALLRKIMDDSHGDECVIWPFNRHHRSGHAVIYWNGKNQFVGRVICELRDGPAPSDLHLGAHSCGRGHEGCVNPDHLSWETYQENNDDMVAHGTRMRGSKNHKAKMTESDVLEARRLRGLVSQQSLADRFGVTQAVISKTQRGETWR